MASRTMIPDHAPQFTLGRQRTGRNPDSARALFAPTRRFLSSPLCRFGHYPFSSASVNLQPQRYEPSKTRSDCGSLGFILFLGRLLRHSSTAITFCKSSMSMKMVSFTTDPPPHQLFTEHTTKESDTDPKPAEAKDSDCEFCDRL